MNEQTINDAQTIRGGLDSALGRIDQYELVRELGGGGFGTVYLARDTVAGIDVAVKGLPPLIRNNAEELERIRENFALVSRLHHPYIAAALHLQLARDVAYASEDVRQKLRVMPGDTLMVMAYAPGVTLSKWRKQFPGGKVPLDQALQIGWQIAQALDYAHEQHIIHRDIKPSNIMVETKPDGEAAARLLDFGLAAEVRSSMGRVSREVHDTSGTRPYMAPEQWEGRKQGPATDQYALAVLLCEMLTGEVPFVSAFETGDPMVMMTAVCNREVELPEDCPRKVALRRALAKKPAQRFPSCMEFIEVAAKREQTRNSEPYGWRTGETLETTQSHGQKPKSSRIDVSQNPRLPDTTVTRTVLGCLFAAVAIGFSLWSISRSQSGGQTASQGSTGSPKRVVVDDSAAKAAATEIRIEALVQKGKIERLSDADGFKERKDDLLVLFDRADALFDEKVKRWSAAAQAFTNYVRQCEALVTLDGARQAAIRGRKEAQAAFQKAEMDGARTYAVTRWNAAREVWMQAAADFSAMRFTSAGTTFASLIAQFELCSKEAKEERDRQARERQRRAKWRKTGEQFTINDPYGLNLTMKWCPAGTFTMGSPLSEEGRNNDEVQHQVTLTKGFWMGETEVTQGQWKKLMDGETILDLGRKLLQDNNLYRLGGKQQKLRDWYGGKTEYDDPQGVCGDPDDDVPVYHVSWSEAVEFCRKLTQRERKEGRIPDGYEYRLPTEAEWEYTCRAGTTTALPNGRDIRILGEGNAPALDDIAWYGGNSSVGFEGIGWDTSNWKEKQYDDKKRAAPRVVKRKLPNKWGLYDMIGNLWEWCDDWYGGYGYDRQTDPTGPSSGAFRVNRGGSWDRSARNCRSAYRDWFSPGIRFNHLGFRVALAPSH